MLITYIFSKVVLQSLPENLLADDLRDKACHSCGAVVLWVCGVFDLVATARELSFNS